MLKRFLLAAVIASFCSTSGFAQDVFVAFGDSVLVNGGVGEALSSTASGDAGTSGTAFVYVQDGFTFDGFQVDLISTNTDVANITSGFTVNSDFDVVGGTRFNNAAVDTKTLTVYKIRMRLVTSTSSTTVAGANGATRFQATSINQNGIQHWSFRRL